MDPRQFPMLVIFDWAEDEHPDPPTPLTSYFQLKKHFQSIAYPLPRNSSNLKTWANLINPPPRFLPTGRRMNERQQMRLYDTHHPNYIAPNSSHQRLRFPSNLTNIPLDDFELKDDYVPRSLDIMLNEHLYEDAHHLPHSSRFGFLVSQVVSRLPPDSLIWDADPLWHPPLAMHFIPGPPLPTEPAFLLSCPLTGEPYPDWDQHEYILPPPGLLPPLPPCPPGCQPPHPPLPYLPPDHPLYHKQFNTIGTPGGMSIIQHMGLLPPIYNIQTYHPPGLFWPGWKPPPFHPGVAPAVAQRQRPHRQ